ncbi:MAG: DUF3575 domain-containing protein [Bacteroidaceae bacterium]|nr:DUF3575 domain-containing protein [Bacteroidaceae bacterium]
MRKLLTMFAILLVTSMTARAQFEQNKWYFNAAVTELGLTYSGSEKFRMGVQASAGTFLFDNLALLLNAEGVYHKQGDRTASFGVGARYYFQQNGIFLGTGVKFKHYEYKGDEEITTDFNDGLWSLEAGYAFFLSRTVTIEPSVYYDLSFKDSDYSKLGLKIGFGLYF